MNAENTEATLWRIRGDRIKSTFEHLNRVLALERQREDTTPRPPYGGKGMDELNQLLLELDPRNRDAIVAVLKFEIEQLMVWTRFQAGAIPLQAKARRFS